MSQEKLEKTRLAVDLTRLYDEFQEFNADCAFFCDAAASLAAEENGLDESTVEGLRRQSYWMKQKMDAFELKLKRIQKKSRDQAGQAPEQ
ncbi:MAG: hypothetical protein MJA83_10565 [Gammaproteobacteria bacterium]|nr:hypothetical protein [Gammaproteobacteria bacterium]